MVPEDGGRKFRTLAARPFRWAADIVGGDRWRVELGGQWPKRPGLRRRGAVRFADVDRLNAFVEAVDRYRHQLGHESTVLSTPRLVDRPPTLAEQVQVLTTGPRLGVLMVVGVDMQLNDPPFEITFGTGEDGYPRGVVIEHESVGMAAREFAAMVDEHTTPVPWWVRRKRISLVSPLPAATARQQEHDDEIERRAAWTGGLVGAVAAGGVTGLVGLARAIWG